MVHGLSAKLSLLKTTIISLASAVIVACSSGAGEEATSSAGPSDGQENPNVGRLLYDESGVVQSYAFDKQKIQSLYKFPSKSQFISSDGSLHALIYFNVQDVKSYVYVIDMKTQQLLYSLSTVKEFQGPPVLSRDNQYLAVFHRDFGDPTLQIYEASGGRLNLIRSISLVEGKSAVDIKSWAWLADNQLLFSLEGTLYKLKDLVSGEPEVLKDFPGQFVGHLDVSPTGDSIAFTLAQPGAYDEEGAVYTLSIKDAAEPHQLTVPGYGWIGDISWSPDGKYLVALDMIESGNFYPGIDLDNCPDVYVLPADADQSAYLRSDNPAPATKLRYYNGSSNKWVDVCADNFLDWRS